MKTTIGAIMAAAWLLAAAQAHAWSGGPRNSCPMPDRSLVTEPTESSVSVNTYQHGSVLCIVDFVPDSCPLCKAGWRHRCGDRNDGQWRPIAKCSAAEIKKAKLARGPESPSDSGAGTSAGRGSAGDSTGSKHPDEASSQPSCDPLSPDASDLTARMVSEGGVDRSMAETANRRLSIGDVVQQAGGLSNAINATQAQISVYQAGLNQSDCTFSSQHAQACALLRIGIDSNQRMLAWLQCHQRKGI